MGSVSVPPVPGYRAMLLGAMLAALPVGYLLSYPLGAAAAAWDRWWHGPDEYNGLLGYVAGLGVGGAVSPALGALGALALRKAGAVARTAVTTAVLLVPAGLWLWAVFLGTSWLPPAGWLVPLYAAMWAVPFAARWLVLRLTGRGGT